MPQQNPAYFIPASLYTIFLHNNMTKAERWTNSNTVDSGALKARKNSAEETKPINPLCAQISILFHRLLAYISLATIPALYVAGFVRLLLGQLHVG